MQQVSFSLVDVTKKIMLSSYRTSCRNNIPNYQLSILCEGREIISKGIKETEMMSHCNNYLVNYEEFEISI